MAMPLCYAFILAESVTANVLQEQPWWDKLPEYAWYIIFAFGGLIVVFVVFLVYCLCCVKVEKPDEADLEMVKHFYMRDNSRTTSEFLHQTGAGPAKGLGTFMREYPRDTQDDSDVRGSLSATLGRKVKKSLPSFMVKPKPGIDRGNKPDFTFSTQTSTRTPPKMPRPEKSDTNLESNSDVASDEEMRAAWANKQDNNRRAKGLSYGRLDPEAQQRVASVRLLAAQGGIAPIQVSKPSAKALRMMGVTEAEVAKPFSETTEQRMKRIARNAGGGVYSTNFGTAALGNQIIAGFQQRKDKLNKRAEKKAVEKENVKIAQKIGAQKAQDTLKRKKKKVEQKPGQSKLAAFLEYTEGEQDEEDFEMDANHRDNEDFDV
eukprot:CAMPEP_0204870064 /NCGR_PEP_ID=MMETSP1348-20121228/31396_1 /ASSEMBLY_ACC=CAM_ASM_000700 /TAXON_ID=215587 /ORGANISM="Aplanochytrium stocchinoi, Strain GSBS06" /LENGTH=374 /DNA_ID=CAMNT_0052023677 /DNA_START=90 /DNA_END=1215 /DNA_ORIENTATION=+